MAPYYEIFIDKPFSFVREPLTEYCKVWDRPISFVEKLQIGPRRYHLFGQRPVEFEVYNHDVAIVRIRRNVNLIFRNYSLPEGKVFNIGLKKVPFIDFQDGEVKKINFLAGQEFAIYKTSFFLEGRNDQQVRWSQDKDGYGDFFEDLCLLDISRQLGLNLKQTIPNQPKTKKMIES